MQDVVLKGASGQSGRAAYFDFGCKANTRGESGFSPADLTNSNLTLFYGNNGLNNPKSASRSDGNTYNGAINLQSIGGRGGDGGDDHAFLCYPGVKPGGNGGNGGTINVTLRPGEPSANYIFHSTAVVLVSAGGLGGKGGGTEHEDRAGDAGLGGSGGDINFTNEMQITTYAKDGYGIFARSVGGQGGQGGFNNGVLWSGPGGAGFPGGTGGSVSLTNKADITADQAIAIFAQSAGGRGGDGGTSANLFDGNGGSGGIGADSGNVTITNSGTLLTGGLGNAAIFAQSIGGGGGNGGLAIGLSALGGSGGGGGNSGDVYVANTGNIGTQGASSMGIFAQSIGGGGGLGGMAFAVGATSIAIGGTGGAAAEAGHVTVINSGNICTGNSCMEAGRPFTGGVSAGGAFGIFAQSVGGGCGSGGFG
ncbi:MAG: hypothetical protein WCO82_10505, partial [Sphingomonadales bacterium]